MKPTVNRTAGPSRAAAAGIVAGAVAIAASELLAGVIPGAPSLVVAAGTLVIAVQPPGAKDLVATLFGTNDKTALNVAVVVVALLVAAAAGILGRSSFGRAWRIFAAFGFVAFVAALLQPLDPAPLAALNAMVATAAGVGTLRSLLADAGSLAPLALRAGAAGRPDLAPADLAPAAPAMPDWDRRRFLLRGPAASWAVPSPWAPSATCSSTVSTRRAPPCRRTFRCPPRWCRP